MQQALTAQEGQKKGLTAQWVAAGVGPGGDGPAPPPKVTSPGRFGGFPADQNDELLTPTPRDSPAAFSGSAVDDGATDTSDEHEAGTPKQWLREAAEAAQVAATITESALSPSLPKPCVHKQPAVPCGCWF